MQVRRWFRVEYLIVLLAIAVRLIPGPRTVDDAYITFRYSQNLLNGYGLVYNPGEAVLGTTTPLYALLLSLAASVFGGSQAPYPVIALWINALADGITCFLLLRLGRKVGYTNAGLATGLLWALSPMSVTFSIGGMETSFFILILMGSLYMYSTHRPVPAALLAAFSILTRPDALLAVLPLLGARLLSLRKNTTHRPTLIEVLAFSIPIVTWGIVGFLYYGSPIPQSVTAKAVVYSLPQDAALIRLLQHFATPFQGNLVFGRYYIAIGLLLFPAMSTLGWRRVLQNQRHLWPLAIYPIVYFLTFSIANPLIFRWYLAPPLPIYLLGITMGVESVTRDAKRPPLFWAVSAIFLFLSLNTWTLQPDHGPTRPAPKMAYIKLEEMYVEAIIDLKPLLQESTTIAAGDIGVIGYFSQGTILDLVGLISPVALEYYPLPEEGYVINYAIPSELVLDLQPEFIIMLEVYGRRTLLLDPDFQRFYALHAEYPTDIYGSEAMLVFELREEGL